MLTVLLLKLDLRVHICIYMYTSYIMNDVNRIICLVEFTFLLILNLAHYCVARNADIWPALNNKRKKKQLIIQPMRQI